MDLSQKKLTRTEWNYVEIPVDEQEKEILELIMAGYNHPDICVNTNQSLYEYLKIPQSSEMDAFLFAKYFLPEIEKCSVTKSFAKTFSQTSKKTKPPNKADIIRMQKADQIIATNRSAIFEFVLLDAAFCSLVVSKSSEEVARIRALYSILSYRKLHIRHLNPHLVRFIDECVIPACDPDSPAKIATLVWNARECIEKNADLYKYADRTLYSHQQDLFRIFHNNHHTKKLVLYMAPTGTGKTMSPIGLSNEYRVIFVCVARHVGLALAKSAISVNKRVAFAFGCETADDIRLHYFAAADYTTNKRSGGIQRVDNSNGSRVEIMICDVASYLVAMYYMKSFFPERDIITYWDEPTISMDYETHDIHAMLARNWRENQIGQMVLSCATLPKSDEIAPVIQNFRERFATTLEEEDEEYMGGDLVLPDVHVIDSFDCKKTIAIQNKNGDTVLPHQLFDAYRDVVRCADHCDANRTLLRYFDIGEIVQFIKTVERMAGAVPEEWTLAARFKKMRDVTLFSIKLHYLDVLRNLQTDWTEIMDQVRANSSHHRNILHMKSVDSAIPSSAAASRQDGGGGGLKRMASVQSPPLGGSGSSGGPPEKILITTRDAHTLTDGPTIFLTNDVNKIGQFYIQQSKIPEAVLNKIQETIDKNTQITKQLTIFEREMEEKSATKSNDVQKQQDSRKAEKEPMSKELRQLQEQIDQLKEMIQTVRLPAIFVPNTTLHQNLWTKTPVPNAFVPNVDDDEVREIMALSVDNHKKILLILGIGVFSGETEDAEYMEIMKRLAQQQSLFLIIAASDYIYGTNYQFCHGFIGKDLVNMTQQKTIQAIGRIGRNALQQEYTVRFRDDAVLKQLFQPQKNNREAVTMTRLFTTTQ